MVENMNNRGFDISSIVRSAGMGNSTLHHVFEKIVGQLPIQYLRKFGFTGHA